MNVSMDHLALSPWGPISSVWAWDQAIFRKNRSRHTATRPHKCHRQLTGRGALESGYNSPCFVVLFMILSCCFCWQVYERLQGNSIISLRCVCVCVCSCTELKGTRPKTGTYQVSSAVTNKITLMCWETRRIQRGFSAWRTCRLWSTNSRNSPKQDLLSLFSNQETPLRCHHE